MTKTAAPVQIFFRTAKNGRKMAYRAGRNGSSFSFRVGLADAEQMIATGEAIEVTANIWKA